MAHFQIIGRGKPIVAVLLLASGLSDVRAQAGPPAAAVAPPPRVALLDLDRSVVGPLLQNTLSANGKLEWVERDRLDAVLREQILGETFGAAAAPARVRIGKLLSADVLILLRTTERPAATGQKKPIKQIDLVVADCDRGLRLAMETLPASADATADAEQLRNVVELGLKKYRERVRLICAVPPLVSRDFFFEFDYLKTGLAKAIEGSLLDRPGTLLVELAEAEALGRENRLAGQDVPERPQPYFLLGEFRNEGSGTKRRITIRLQLMHGGAEAAAESGNELRPDDTVQFCVAGADRLLAKIDGKPLAFDASAETAVLVSRARLLMQLGSWSEAMPLLEAALLLSPNRLGVLGDAVVVSRRLGDVFVRNAKDPTIARPALRQYRRGLEHIEAFVDRVPDLKHHESRSAAEAVDAFPFFRFNRAGPRVAPEIKQEYDEILAVERQVLLRLTAKRAEALSRDPAVSASDGSFAEINVIIPKALRARVGPDFRVETLSSSGDVDDFSFLWLSADGLSDEQRFETIFKTMEQLYALPGARPRAYRMARGPYQLTRAFNNAPALAFLAKLKQDDRPEFREAGERITKLIDERQELQQRVATGAGHPDYLVGEPRFPQSALRLRYSPIKIVAPTTKGAELEVPPLSACIPIGPHLDLLATSRYLLVMKEKGRAQGIYAAKGKFAHISNLSFDGRYAWMTIHKAIEEPPELVVVDLKAKRAWPVTAEQGLPVAPPGKPRDGLAQTLNCVPVAPGKACVAGSFGHSWIAIVEIDPTQGPSVHKIYEAVVQSDDAHELQALKTDVAYRIGYMYALAGDQADSQKRVLVGRIKGNNHDMDHPWTVDLEQLRVEVLQGREGERLSIYPAVMRSGRLYFLEHLVPSRETRLAKLGPPGIHYDALVHNLPIGRLLLGGESFHVVGKKWWTGNLKTGKVETVAEQVPWYFHNEKEYPGSTTNIDYLGNLDSRPMLAGVFRSAHYGFLASVQGEPRLLQIELKLEVQSDAAAAAAD